MHDASAVLGAVERAPQRPGLTAELVRAQLETVSGVCVDERQLRHEVARLRRSAAREARADGHLLVACGTPLLGVPGGGSAQGQPDQPDEQCVGACHVRIGVPERQDTLDVANHLRLWTPLLLALSANSPYWYGHDTAHASWRSVLWGRRPTSGPPPYLRSSRHHEETVQALVDSGAAADPGAVCWSVRPARQAPAVEARVGDVMPTVQDTVGYALLVRALAAAALTDARAGRAAPPVDETVLRAACWRAARDGMAGTSLLVPVSGRARPVPAWAAVTALLRHVRPHLEVTGDTPTVARWLRTLQTRGTGADRQRAAQRRRGRLEDAVDALAVPAFSYVGYADHVVTEVQPLE